jgi:predicted SprT family Zn-dependent metalloprotease
MTVRGGDDVGGGWQVSESDYPRDATLGAGPNEYKKTYVTRGYYCTSCNNHFKLRQWNGKERPKFARCPKCQNVAR